MVLEVCVDSFESFMTARKAGAGRIELCSALELGGLTPSYGLMKRVSAYRDIEIFVMVRTRRGDFLYSQEDYQVIKEEIELVKELGFDGLVLGFLKKDGRLDLGRLEEIVSLARPLKVALHRAFDDARDPFWDVEKLIDMGIIRILTSGQRPSALEGADYISRLVGAYGDRIEIMPGAGINSENLEEIYKKTSARSFHMSGRTSYRSAMEDLDYTRRMKTGEGELFNERADYRKIKEVRRILDRLGG